MINARFVVGERRSFVRRCQTRVGWEKQTILKINASISRKLQEIRPKLLVITNKVAYALLIDTKSKSPRSMTLNCIILEFFREFRRFERQQQLNK